MSTIIGKILATEKNPSTIEEFYFWTKPERILNPFDVVKVKHINDSITFGVVEEISHITDTANFLSEYISNDFGDVNIDAPTHRIGMNYVKAKILGNSKGVYIPVFNGSEVGFASKDEVAEALGLSNIKENCRIPCGYIEMYKGADEEDRVKITVNMDWRYLIGPEGAHLNISGISGLAAKTSYAMFLMKSIQDKCLNDAALNDDEEDDPSVAFVIFNVKGRDLLAIHERNKFENDAEEEQTLALYKELGMSPEPFKNVHYYYPYSTDEKWSTFLDRKVVMENIRSGKAHMYKYEYEHDKDSIELMFSNVDDPTQSMESILGFILNGNGEFENITEWPEFLKRIKARGEAKAGHPDKTITVQSWRRFARLINKVLYRNPIFDSIKNENDEIRLGQALKQIRKNEVHVIDIAKLNSDMQSFVFGDAIKTIYELQSCEDITDDEYRPPSKILVFVDELNKYAGSDAPKTSPILRYVLDVAERGRSLGVVLFAAEQFKSAIHDRVTGNCSTLAYGRTNAIELAKSDYRFVPQVYKSMMTRLEQGEYIVQNPIFRSLINVRFPRPIYKQFKS